jgi:hypothetical protein
VGRVLTKHDLFSKQKVTLFFFKTAILKGECKAIFEAAVVLV